MGAVNTKLTIENTKTQMNNSKETTPTTMAMRIIDKNKLLNDDYLNGDEIESDGNLNIENLKITTTTTTTTKVITFIKKDEPLFDLNESNNQQNIIKMKEEKNEHEHENEKNKNEYFYIDTNALNIPNLNDNVHEKDNLKLNLNDINDKKGSDINLDNKNRDSTNLDNSINSCESSLKIIESIINDDIKELIPQTSSLQSFSINLIKEKDSIETTSNSIILNKESNSNQSSTTFEQKSKLIAGKPPIIPKMSKTNNKLINQKVKNVNESHQDNENKAKFTFQRNQYFFRSLREASKRIFKKINLVNNNTNDKDSTTTDNKNNTNSNEFNDSNSNNKYIKNNESIIINDNDNDNESKTKTSSVIIFDETLKTNKDKVKNKSLNIKSKSQSNLHDHHQHHKDKDDINNNNNILIHFDNIDKFEKKYKNNNLRSKSVQNFSKRNKNKKIEIEIRDNINDNSINSNNNNKNNPTNTITKNNKNKEAKYNIIMRTRVKSNVVSSDEKLAKRLTMPADFEDEYIKLQNLNTINENNDNNNENNNNVFKKSSSTLFGPFINKNEKIEVESKQTSNPTETTIGSMFSRGSLTTRLRKSLTEMSIYNNRDSKQKHKHKSIKSPTTPQYTSDLSSSSSDCSKPDSSESASFSSSVKGNLSSPIVDFVKQKSASLFGTKKSPPNVNIIEEVEKEDFNIEEMDEDNDDVDYLLNIANEYQISEKKCDEFKEQIDKTVKQLSDYQTKASRLNSTESLIIIDELSGQVNLLEAKVNV
jgi:hypothetical protein